MARHFALFRYVGLDGAVSVKITVPNLERWFFGNLHAFGWRYIPSVGALFICVIAAVAASSWVDRSHGTKPSAGVGVGNLDTAVRLEIAGIAVSFFA